jgi:hypothetical protein
MPARRHRATTEPLRPNSSRRGGRLADRLSASLSSAPSSGSPPPTASPHTASPHKGMHDTPRCETTSERVDGLLRREAGRGHAQFGACTRPASVLTSGRARSWSAQVRSRLGPIKASRLSCSTPYRAAWPSTVGSRWAATRARRNPKTCRQTMTDHDRRSTQREAAYLGFLIGSHAPQYLRIPPRQCSVGSDTEEAGGSTPPAPTTWS